MPPATCISPTADNNRIRKVATNGIITTVAGNGGYGYAGDGGAATNASLYYPAGVAVDAAGNLYIADSDNNRIRKVDTNGIITTVAGNGGSGYSGDGGAATNASLDYPDGVAVDAVRQPVYCGLRQQPHPHGGHQRHHHHGGGQWQLPADSGDGGAATNASLWHPAGVALMPGQPVYC